MALASLGQRQPPAPATSASCRFLFSHLKQHNCRFPGTETAATLTFPPQCGICLSSRCKAGGAPRPVPTTHPSRSRSRCCSAQHRGAGGAPGRRQPQAQPAGPAGTRFTRLLLAAPSCLSALAANRTLCFHVNSQGNTPSSWSGPTNPRYRAGMRCWGLSAKPSKAQAVAEPLSWAAQVLPGPRGQSPGMAARGTNNPPKLKGRWRSSSAAQLCRNGAR